MMTQELGRLQHWPCPPRLGTDPESLSMAGRARGGTELINSPRHSERMNHDQGLSREPGLEQQKGWRQSYKAGLRSMQHPGQEAGTHLTQLRWVGDTGLSRNEVLAHKQKVLGGRCRAATAISALGALMP